MVLVALYSRPLIAISFLLNIKTQNLNFKITHTLQIITSSVCLGLSEIFNFAVVGNKRVETTGIVLYIIYIIVAIYK